MHDKPILRADELPLDQQQSISKLQQVIHDWFEAHPDRASAVHSIALFGSRATGLSDPELSDWDLYLIEEDEAPPGPMPSDDLHMFEECPTEWHASTLTGYRTGIKASSLSLSNAVEKFGISIYGSIPEATDSRGTKQFNTMHIDQLIDALRGIVSTAAALTNEIDSYVIDKELGFPSRTRDGEPYLPELFKHSSNFAEHVSKLIVSFRGITPRTVHQMDRLAEQLDPDDPYKERIAALNGATCDGNIAFYSNPSPPPEKAQDEPVDRSRERSADAMRLLSDFLRENESAIQTTQVSNESSERLRGRINYWKRKIESDLYDILQDNPSEEWIESIWQDSQSINRSLTDLFQRVQFGNLRRARH